jgi:hypothetical protein
MRQEKVWQEIGGEKVKYIEKAPLYGASSQKEGNSG